MDTLYLDIPPPGHPLYEHPLPGHPPPGYPTGSRGSAYLLLSIATYLVTRGNHPSLILPPFIHAIHLTPRFQLFDINISKVISFICIQYSLVFEMSLALSPGFLQPLFGHFLYSALWNLYPTELFSFLKPFKDYIARA